MFRAAAEQGNATAQVSLAGLYVQGYGVPQDYKQATGWFRKAAEQNNPEAQASLSAAYGLGNGVPKDSVLAYMWANLSAAGANDEEQRKKSVELREIAAKSLTPEQVGEAQRLSREWTPTKAK